MTQREFNMLMDFQPAVMPHESLRDLVRLWFDNDLGGEYGEDAAKAYLEAIRAEFVPDEPITREPGS